MAAEQHLEAVPEGLVRALREGRVVASVGSGFSFPAGLPNWEALLRAVVRDCRVQGVQVPDEAAHASHDELDAVQFRVFAAAGKAPACEVLRRELSAQENPVMTRRLDALFALPLAGLITWNWDDVLDARCELLSNDPEGYGEGLPRWPPAGPPPLLKMQGRLDEAAQVVVDGEDYERVRPYRDAFLQRLYLDSDLAVLHIGQGGIGEGTGIVGPIRTGVAGQERHYAICPGATEEQCARALAAEGTRILSYDPAAGHEEGLCGLLGAMLQRSQG